MNFVQLLVPSPRVPRSAHGSRPPRALGSGRCGAALLGDCRRPRWTPAIAWEQLCGTAAGLQELRTDRQLLSSAFNFYQFTNVCCQAEGHRPTAAAQTLSLPA